MTPGARVAAAISILDEIQAGVAAEKALTNWARNSRYAGSKDRAAVRDHVFDVLRCKRSYGDGSGRSLMTAWARANELDIDMLFSGVGHAPAPLTADERQGPGVLSEAAKLDLPDWLWSEWQASLGDAAAASALAQQSRAPVFLRVNGRRASLAQAVTALSDDGIATEPHPSVPTALRVTQNPRKIVQSTAFVDGLIELQDAASQAAVAQVNVPGKGRLLEYCAGYFGSDFLRFCLKPKTNSCWIYSVIKSDGLPSNFMCFFEGHGIALARSA